MLGLLALLHSFLCDCDKQHREHFIMICQIASLHHTLTTCRAKLGLNEYEVVGMYLKYTSIQRQVGANLCKF